MNCWFCNSQLIWQNDYTYEELEIGENGQVTQLACLNYECGAFCEISRSFEEVN